MAAGQTAREKLVGFLDQEAFVPILRARPDDYAAADEAQREHVQDVPERTHQRYRDEGASAWGICNRFGDHVSSSAAEQVQRKLEGRCATARTRSHTSAETWR